MEITITKEVGGFYRCKIYNSISPELKLTAAAQETKSEAINSMVQSLEIHKERIDETISELKNM